MKGRMGDMRDRRRKLLMNAIWEDLFAFAKERKVVSGMFANHVIMRRVVEYLEKHRGNTQHLYTHRPVVTVHCGAGGLIYLHVDGEVSYQPGSLEEFSDRADKELAEIEAEGKVVKN